MADNRLTPTVQPIRRNTKPAQLERQWHILHCFITMNDSIFFHWSIQERYTRFHFLEHTYTLSTHVYLNQVNQFITMRMMINDDWWWLMMMDRKMSRATGAEIEFEKYIYLFWRGPFSNVVKTCQIICIIALSVLAYLLACCIMMDALNRIKLTIRMANNDCTYLHIL